MENINVRLQPKGTNLSKMIPIQCAIIYKQPMWFWNWIKVKLETVIMWKSSHSLLIKSCVIELNDIMTDCLKSIYSVWNYDYFLPIFGRLFAAMEPKMNAFALNSIFVECYEIFLQMSSINCTSTEQVWVEGINFSSKPETSAIIKIAPNQAQPTYIERRVCRIRCTFCAYGLHYSLKQQ